MFLDDKKVIEIHTLHKAYTSLTESEELHEKAMEYVPPFTVEEGMEKNGRMDAFYTCVPATAQLRMLKKVFESENTFEPETYWAAANMALKSKAALLKNHIHSAPYVDKDLNASIDELIRSKAESIEHFDNGKNNGMSLIARLNVSNISMFKETGDIAKAISPICSDVANSQYEKFLNACAPDQAEKSLQDKYQAINTFSNYMMSFPS